MRYILDQLPNYTYSKDKISKKWLDKNGFTYNRILSDQGDEAFSLRFPVYKYGDFICIDSEITVFFKSKDIRVDCYDHNTRNCYARWYCRDLGNDNALISIIASQVEKKLKELNIKINYPKNWELKSVSYEEEFD